MDPFVAEVIRQGILGLVIAGFLTGHIIPKWKADEYRATIKARDATIERQARAIERVAQRAARLSDLSPDILPGGPPDG